MSQPPASYAEGELRREKFPACRQLQAGCKPPKWTRGVQSLHLQVDDDFYILCNPTCVLHDTVCVVLPPLYVTTIPNVPGFVWFVCSSVKSEAGNLLASEALK